MSQNKRTAFTAASPSMHRALVAVGNCSKITQHKNGVLTVAAEDIRRALAILAKAGAEIEGFSASICGRPPCITIARPVRGGIVSAVGLVGIEHTQFGNRNRYRGMVHHVAVEWVI